MPQQQPQLLYDTMRSSHSNAYDQNFYNSEEDELLDVIARWQDQEDWRSHFEINDLSLASAKNSICN